MGAPSTPPRSCADCGAPLDHLQRYCLRCGSRVGPRSHQLAELLRRMRARDARRRSPGTLATTGVRAALTPPSPAGAGVEAIPARSGSAGASASGLRLPSRPVSALLVAAFLGFGVLLGSAASSPVDSTLASSRRPLKLVIPQASGGGGSPTASSTPPAASSSGAVSPPEAEPTSTPSAGIAATPPAKTPVAPSSGAGGKAPSAGSEGGEAPESSSSGPAAGGSHTSEAAGPATKLPPLKHVFEIVLSEQPYAAAFGPSSTTPYLGQTLEHKGELLVRYDAVAHQGLADGIALVSGQGPTAETAANCPTYANIAPAQVSADEQVLGNGCVYPKSAQTIADQLQAKHMTWRAYLQGVGEAPGNAAACGHPTLGASDPTTAQPAAGYATWGDPFLYFHSVIDAPTCPSENVGIGELRSDLSRATSTPNFLYIAPDRCHDGSPTACAPGAPAGMAPAETFLKSVVPTILASKAYRESGLLIITVDHAPSSGAFADSSSCCGQPQFPNLPASSSGLAPRGGGQVGALLLSPYIKGGSTAQEQPYNHLSLLRTIEDVFGVAHLGYAALPKVSSLEASLFLSAPQH